MSFGAPFPAGRREVLRTHLDHAENGSGASSYSFAGLNFGTASVDRYIVVGVTWLGSVTLTGVTIGGIAATSLVSAGAGRLSAILIAKVPTGTSGTVALTFSGSASSAAVDLYSVVGIASAAAASTATSVANNPTASLNVARNGVVIAVAAAGAGSPPSATWTGLTEDTDDNYGASNFQCRSSASAQFSTAQTGLTVTCTFSTTAGSAGCFAVFEPA